ncbi:hypothetical protein OAH36_03830 [Verrucomicrobia bacterium]|jgi:hypothetical protein|nr:hypothetical protein [Verrucomicrobiota bacterium]MDB4746288.1 hypothetical protein [Verrucomicrobiota bacterium]MDB4798708.1 hypothetical protein [Verrucomicrobiota bacterium]
MKKPSRGLAIFLILVSSLGLCSILWSIVSSGFRERNEGPILVGVIVGMAFLIVPLALGLYFGCRLLVHTTKENIKGCVGVFSFFCVVLLMSLMKLVLPPEIVKIISLLVATILVLPIYVFFSKYLIQKDLDEAVDEGKFIGKGILLLIAWQIWHVLYQVIDLYAPTKMGRFGIKEEPWDNVQSIGPLVIACLFYLIASWFIKREIVEPACVSVAKS